MLTLLRLSIFFFNDPARTEIYTLSLHDALPISRLLPGEGVAQAATHRRRARQELRLGPPLQRSGGRGLPLAAPGNRGRRGRSEEHTSELQSLRHLVCRLLLEKKKT